jgi:hypothetical protein
MKDANLAILNAYKSTLANLIVGGVTIPVYSKSAPLKNVPAKYVILSSQTRLQELTKCGYWYLCTINVQIVTRYPNGNGDLSFSMVIGEEIQNRIQATNLSLSNFINVDTLQLLTNEVTLETETENIFQYILTFQHKLNRT